MEKLIILIALTKMELLILKVEKKFNFYNYKYFDYGYAITDYKAQGVTSDNVIVYANSDMATFNSLYTQVTRAKNEIKVFTNNKDLLKEKVNQECFKSSTIPYLETQKSIEKQKREVVFAKEQSKKKTNLRSL